MNGTSQSAVDRVSDDDAIAQVRPPHIRLIGCAAPPVVDIGKLVRMIKGRGWTCDVVLTPNAVEMFFERYPGDRTEIDHLEKLTGYPVRTDYYKAGEARHSVPKPDVFMAAPATVNTIGKAIVGLGDTLAAGILVEKIGAIAYGDDVDLVVVPYTHQKHAAHPMFQYNLALLEYWGVDVMRIERFGYELPVAHTNGAIAETFPWHLAADELDRRLSARDLSSAPDLDRSLVLA